MTMTRGRLMAYVAAAAMTALSPISVSAHARYDESRYEPLKRLSIRELYEKGWASHDPDSTMICLTVALNKYRERPTEEDKVYYVRALNAMASTYLVKFNDFYEAYYYFLEAKKEADALRNPKLEAMLDYNMACVHTSIGEIDQAFKNYGAALDISSANKDWYIYQAAFSGLVLNAVTEGRLEEMDRELARFATLQLPDTTMSAYTRCLYEGARSLRSGDYDGAIRDFERSSAHIDADFAAEMYRDFPSLLSASVYAMKGDTAMAITVFKSNLDRYSPDNRADSYKWMADLYRRTGRTDSAEHCMLAYYREAEACGALKRQEDMSRAKVSVNLRELQTDLAAEAERGRRVRTIAWYTAAWSLLLLCVLGLLWRTNRNLKRSKRELFNKLRQLSELEERSESNDETAHQAAPGDRDDTPASPDEDTSAASEASSSPDGEQSDESMRELADKVKELMHRSPEIYSQDFSIGSVAAMLGEHPHKISKVINDVLGKRFNTWLSELRVEEACRRLADTEKYGNLTISAIAEELGYKSRTHFAGVFKKQTGLSPTEYQKFAMEEKRNSES